MGRLAAFLAIAAVLGLVAWWLFRSPVPIMPAIADTGSSDLPRDAGPAVEPLAQSKPAERKITPTALPEAPADRAATRAGGETERVLGVEADSDSIQGLIRDDGGNPVPGVRVDIEPRGTDASGRERLATTGADGAFRIQRVNQPADVAVSLSASHSEFDPIGPFRFEWGRKDVVLALRRGPTVEIAVRDGDRDEPLERYGVRVFEAPPGPRRRSPDDFRIREAGDHPGGVLQLRGVRSGRQVLVVEAEGPDRSPTVAQEFEMSGSGAPRQEVTVWRNVRKTVRVKRADGSPVRGSKVELIRQFSSAPVGEETRALEAAQAYLFAPVHALLIDGGETGENGAVELAGPPRESLSVRALGPGHVPLVREVDFGASQPVIELVVGGGATFLGKVGPPELLAQLEPAEWKQRGGQRGSGAGMYLLNPSSSEHTRFPRQLGVVPFEADGSFRLDAIPPGAWEVHVSYLAATSGGGWTNGSLEIATVDVVDGQERHASYDLSHLLQAEIEGVVTLDGKPLKDATASLVGRQQLAGGGSAAIGSPIIRLGPDGKFRTPVWPAEYFLVASVVRDGRDVDLHDSTYFRVGPGEKLARTFDLRSSILKLRVVASDGVTPVSGVRLMFEVPRIFWPSEARPTDADGRVEVEGLPSLPVAVLTWPKDLSTREALGEFFRTNKVRPENVRVRVTTVTVTPPETSATIVLPASAGY